MTCKASLTDVRRPVLRYHGGKWKLAPWLISMFPAHRIYVEPFGGGGSVLLRKGRSYAEVYNDLDGRICELFRVLRDPEMSGRLRQALYLTPFARAEFEGAAESADDPVDRARCLIVRSHMGFGSDSLNPARTTGFRANSNRSGSTPARDWRNYPAMIDSFADRLRGVVVEHRDAIEVMCAHDGPQTLHYLDPPYVRSTRSEGRSAGNYVFEMTDADHARLADCARSMCGAVIVSGYNCPLYERLFAGWHRVDRPSMADGARPRTESVWMNEAARPADLFAECDEVFS